MWWGVPINAGPAVAAAPDEVTTLQKLLNSGRPDVQARRSLLEKLAIAVRVAAERLAERNNPALQAARQLPIPQAVQDPPLRSGIFPGDGGLFHAGQALITNRWQSQIGGSFFQVYAGGTGDNPARGLVVVMVTSSDRTQTQSQVYQAPSGAGPLTITGANGLVLNLQTANGQRLNFDLQTRQFSQ